MHFILIKILHEPIKLFENHLKKYLMSFIELFSSVSIYNLKSIEI